MRLSSAMPFTRISSIASHTPRRSRKHRQRVSISSLYAGVVQPNTKEATERFRAWSNIASARCGSLYLSRKERMSAASRNGYDAGWSWSAPAWRGGAGEEGEELVVGVEEDDSSGVAARRASCSYRSDSPNTSRIAHSSSWMSVSHSSISSLLRSRSSSMSAVHRARRTWRSLPTSTFLLADRTCPIPAVNCESDAISVLASKSWVNMSSKAWASPRVMDTARGAFERS